MSRQPDLGRAHQPSGIVDQPHHPQRGRLLFAAGPDLQRPQEIDRAAEQGSGAVVAIDDLAGDQRGGNAVLRKSDGGGEADRAATDDGNGKMRGTGSVHEGAITAFSARVDVGNGGFRAQELQCKLNTILLVMGVHDRLACPIPEP
ncbi:hypothetical protein BN961_01439 [Afipia felis]|uniref:Uncharacterized protein n=1 Tax=Afipia felis TaxID=1035 RepID=A0A090MKT0_AFIFE|nr:hypothetical protein BN961_01439 [Afipia felis]